MFKDNLEKELKRFLKKRVTINDATIIAFLLTGILSFSLPSGEKVVNGNVSFERNNHELIIRNNDGSIVNWENFDISKNEIVRIIQENSDSSILNRVLEGKETLIEGLLESNANVYLINTSGILIGDGARIDTNGFTASTFDISDEDFKNKRYLFEGDSGKISNNGVILVRNGKLNLIGNTVENLGLIENENGEILLASGNRIEIVNAKNSKIRYNIEAPEGKTINLGNIIANNRLEIRGSEIVIKGEINSSGNDIVIGNRGETKKLDVDGTIKSNSIDKNGGEILLWGDRASYKGNIEATSVNGDGGFIETSGKVIDVDNVNISTKSENGKTGTWLIDPVNIEIVEDSEEENGLNITEINSLFTSNYNIASGTKDNTKIKASTIKEQILNTDLLVTTENNDKNQEGNILINTDLILLNDDDEYIPNLLHFKADGNIIVNGKIKGSKFILESKEGSININENATLTTDKEITIVGKKDVLIKSKIIKEDSDKYGDIIIKSTEGSVEVKDIDNRKRNEEKKILVAGKIRTDIKGEIKTVDNSSKLIIGEVGSEGKIKLHVPLKLNTNLEMYGGNIIIPREITINSNNQVGISGKNVVIDGSITSSSISISGKTNTIINGKLIVNSNKVLFGRIQIDAGVYNPNSNVFINGSIENLRTDESNIDIIGKNVVLGRNSKIYSESEGGINVSGENTILKGRLELAEIGRDRLPSAINIGGYKRINVILEPTSEIKGFNNSSLFISGEKQTVVRGTIITEGNFQHERFGADDSKTFIDPNLNIRTPSSPTILGERIREKQISSYDEPEIPNIEEFDRDENSIEDSGTDTSSGGSSTPSGSGSQGDGSTTDGGSSTPAGSGSQDGDNSGSDIPGASGSQNGGSSTGDSGSSDSGQDQGTGTGSGSQDGSNSGTEVSGSSGTSGAGGSQGGGSPTDGSGTSDSGQGQGTGTGSGSQDGGNSGSDTLGAGGSQNGGSSTGDSGSSDSGQDQGTGTGSGNQDGGTGQGSQDSGSPTDDNGTAGTSNTGNQNQGETQPNTGITTEETDKFDIIKKVPEVVKLVMERIQNYHLEAMRKELREDLEILDRKIGNVSIISNIDDIYKPNSNVKKK